MSERPPAGSTIIKLAWCCLLASVIMAGLLFPVAGGLGLMSNRASDIVANGSAQLLEGDVPAVTTMVDAKGNTIAWLYAQRRFEVPGDQIADTIDYGAVRLRLQALYRDHRLTLLEAFAEAIAHLLIDEFGAAWVRVKVVKPRKFDDVEAVGVVIERTAPSPEAGSAASVLRLLRPAP